MENFIKEHILELEKNLLKSQVRKSSEEIRKLVADDFIEFCSSGKIYNYSVGDTFYEDNVSFEIIDFDLIELSTECMLSRYKIKKVDSDKVIKFSLRSSVWKYFVGEWKMIFHQGTLIN